MIFNLAEKTSGPWNGNIWRSEEMSEREAAERNARISTMQWEPRVEDVIELQQQIELLKGELEAKFKAHRKEESCGRCTRKFLHALK